MQSIQDILKANIQKDLVQRHKYVTQEFQDYGNRLAFKLGNPKQLSMYIKLAKDKPRALLEQAYSFAIDYPNASNKARIFLWKLKELEGERFENLKKKNLHKRIILLDLDGVLIEKVKLFSVRYSQQYLVDIKDMNMFFKGEFQECMVGKKDLKKVLKKYIKPWRWQGTVDQLLKYWFEEEVTFNQKVIETINKLDREIFKIYVCSNEEKYRAEYLENLVSQKLKVDGFLFSNELRLLKKDSKFFNKVMNQFLVEPNQVYYLDDNEKNIRAAEKVGINVYLYPDRNLDEIINEATTKS